MSCLLLNLFPGESGYIYAVCFAVRSVLGLKNRSFFFSHLFSFLSLFLSKRVDIFVRCTSLGVTHFLTSGMSVTFLQIASNLQQIGFIPGSPDWFYSRVTRLVLLQDHRIGFIPGSWDWFYSRITRLVLLQGHRIGFTPGSWVWFYSRSPDWFYSRITRLVIFQDHQIGFTPGSADWFYARITRLVLLLDHQIVFIPGSTDCFYSRIIGLVLLQYHAAYS